MSFYYSLCSSSGGNASYIGTLESGILLDAGIGIRNFSKQLDIVGVTPKQLRGIFITHEHGDHIKGLEAISSRHQIPVYASRGAMEALLDSGRLSGKQPLHIIDTAVEIDDFLVTPFPTSHDSPESLGFRVDIADGKSVGICTDLGYVSEIVRDALIGCDFVMLESNYDESMLKFGSYPPFLKKRIASQLGHLSNQQCAEAIEFLIQMGTKRFALAHLSDENNHPEVALAHARNHLHLKEMADGVDYEMMALARMGEGKVVCL